MKISIVVPTYNRAELIGRTIKSVLSQPAGDWELIIVDDGSVDNTKDLVYELQKNEPRITYIKLADNRGVNFARNIGAKKAEGEWIGFIDSDDEYLEGAFKVICSTLNSVKDDIDVVGFMTLEKINNETKKGGYMVHNFKWDKFYPTYEDIVLKKGGRGDTNFWVRKKIFVQKYFFPEWINGLESLFFSMLIKNGKKFAYINKTVVLVHDDSPARLSVNSYLKRPRQFAAGYSRFVKDHKLVLKKHPRVLFNYYLKIAKCYLKFKNPLFIWWILRAFFVEPRMVIRLLFNKL